MRLVDALRVLVGLSIAVPRAAAKPDEVPAVPVKAAETVPVEVVAVAPDVLAQATPVLAPSAPSSLAEKTVVEARQTREQLERRIGEDPLVTAVEETMRGPERRRKDRKKGAAGVTARPRHAG